MLISPFALERYFAKHEFSAPHLLCCSDCEAMTLSELLAFEPDAQEQFGKLWLGYTEAQGCPDLRRTIASLYETTSADDILVHVGAEEAIFNFMNVVLEKGDHVIVHAPRYQSLGAVAEAIGCEVTDWLAKSDSNWSLDLDELQKLLKPKTKLLVVNLPHNPTGQLMPKVDFLRLVQLSQERGFIIFCDEVYRLLESDENSRLPALVDLDERGVSLGVMSKSFGLAGLRLGWIATRNKKIYSKMAAFKDYTTICSPAPSEFLANLALRHHERLVARNRQIIKENITLFIEFITKWQKFFHWTPPVAGPVAFPKLTINDSAEDFCEELVQKAGVMLAPGHLFGESSKSHFRVGFGRKSFACSLGHFDSFMSGYSHT